MKCSVPRQRLRCSSSDGRTRSIAMRRSRPVTPTKLVSTAPESTTTASRLTHADSSPPSAGAPRSSGPRWPRVASSASVSAATSCSGSSPIANRAISGLNTATAIHMLRRVFGNTPGRCSSMKFAELSKPLMPSIPAQNPKNSAMPTPCPGVGQADGGRARLAHSTDGSEASARTPAAARVHRVAMWNTKMSRATVADSVIPSRASSAKPDSSASVASITGRSGSRRAA